MLIERDGMSVGMPLRVHSCSLICIAALACCAGQSASRLQADAATFDQDLKHFASTFIAQSKVAIDVPTPPRIPLPVQLDKDLSQIVDCMVSHLRMIPGVEDTRVQVYPDDTEPLPYLDVRFQGQSIRFSTNKSNEANRDFYTFVTGEPGLGPPPSTRPIVQIANSIMNCGAQVLVFFL